MIGVGASEDGPATDTLVGKNWQAPDLLRDFRDGLYRCLARRPNALFELTDAILTAGGVHSLPHISLAPIHRRDWGSHYASLDRGRIDVEALRDLLAGLRLADDSGHTRVYAVDRSSWPRCDAETTSPESGYCYHPNRHSAAHPVGAGWAHQLVAGLHFERDSWVTPVDACRVRPEEDANDVAAEQDASSSAVCQGTRRCLLHFGVFVGSPVRSVIPFPLGKGSVGNRTPGG